MVSCPLIFNVMSIQNTKEFNAVMELGDSLNDYSWSPRKFAESIPFLHKTLQQTLIRTLVEVIKKVGEESYPVDLRNKASHELCRGIVTSGIIEDKPLPFV